MFGAMHWDVLLPLLLIALLFFGTKRLPEMGGAVGKTIKEFQRSMKEVREDHDETPAQLPPTSAAVPAQIPAAPVASAVSTTPAATATTVTEPVAE